MLGILVRSKQIWHWWCSHSVRPGRPKGVTASRRGLLSLHATGFCDVYFTLCLTQKVNRLFTLRPWHKGNHQYHIIEGCVYEWRLWTMTKLRRGISCTIISISQITHTLTKQNFSSAFQNHPKRQRSKDTEEDMMRRGTTHVSSLWSWYETTDEDKRLAITVSHETTSCTSQEEKHLCSLWSARTEEAGWGLTQTPRNNAKVHFSLQLDISRLKGKLTQSLKDHWRLLVPMFSIIVVWALIYVCKKGRRRWSKNLTSQD